LLSVREITEKLISVSLKGDEEINLYKNIKQLSKELKDIPQGFICPLTGELFFDPVIADDQQTYEKLAIETWFTKYGQSPLTNKEFESKNLIPNLVLKKLVNAFIEQNKNI